MCKYAVDIHSVLLGNFFTYSDVYHNRSPLRQKVTDSIHFAFDQTVIDDFRVQLGSLIDNLHKIYTRHREGTDVKFGKKRSVAKENNKATKMPQATDIFDYATDCETDSVKDIMAEVEYHIMQQNEDEELHKLLQVDHTLPIDALQPDVTEEGDKKPAAIPVTKVMEKDAIESHPDVVDVVDRKPADVQPKRYDNTMPDGVPEEVKIKKNAAQKGPATVRKQKVTERSNRNVLSSLADIWRESHDPFIGKKVAFRCDSEVVQQVKTALKDKFDKKGIRFDVEPSFGHILGTVMRLNRPTKGCKINTYNVVWEYTAYGESDLPMMVLLDAHKEADKFLNPTISKVQRRRSTKRTTMHDRLTAVSDEEDRHEAPPSESGSTTDSGSITSYNSFDWGVTNSPNKNVDEEQATTEAAEVGEIPSGIHWEFQGTIRNLPEGKMKPSPTTVRCGYEKYFQSPIDAVMAVFPMIFWETIRDEVNKYAQYKITQKQKEKLVKRPRLIASHQWTAVTLQEIMTFFGILIYFMLYPQSGRRMRDTWDSPYHNAWTKFMTKSRFLQICSALHFNDNNDIQGRNQDCLHKVRPLLNILKNTLGRYAVAGSELSLDEATMANKSSYGRFLICFNPSKPTGKFHFKIYMVCCAESNLTLQIKIHAKGDIDEGFSVPTDDQIGKLDNLTVQLCRPFFGSGCTINMDNYYMSPSCAIRLRDHGVFCRGTIRTARKFVPRSILFSASELRTLPRGTHRIAVDHDHHMMAVGWVDNKAVHFVSTADTTDIVTVQRKVGNGKVDVIAPVAVANYNKFMGGVDRHDRLRSSFSLCKAHHFKKYYVKLMLFLMDIGLTNAWIYYKKCNEEQCSKEGSRANFFQSVAEEMVNVNAKWNVYASRHDSLVEEENLEERKVETQCLTTTKCVPTSLDVIPAKIGPKMRVCQVCSYEMRRFKWRSVTLCPNHGVRLCTDVRTSREDSEPKILKTDGAPVTDWTWTCQRTDTCWNKFHTFYLPNGLFNNNICLSSPHKCKFAGIVYSSELYLKKYAALGISLHYKKGTNQLTGLIREKVHLVLGQEATKDRDVTNNERPGRMLQPKNKRKETKAGQKINEARKFPSGGAQNMKAPRKVALKAAQKWKEYLQQDSEEESSGDEDNSGNADTDGEYSSGTETDEE